MHLRKECVYMNNNKLNLSDRTSIEIGIAKGEDFKTIAKKLGRHPSSISREVKNNRTFMRGIYPFGNDCKYVKACFKSHLCGDQDCFMYCYTCVKDCHNYCNEYLSISCHKYNKSPYVCNNCNNRRYCNFDRYFYSAKRAQELTEKRRSDSRSGIRTKGEEFKQLDSLITELIKKGQPLSHIYASHSAELPVCKRTVYNYINQCEMSIKPIDMRRQAGYKKRRKSKDSGNPLLQKYRTNRTYNDYKIYMEDKSPAIVTQMDTVKGKRQKGQVLLTMLLLRNHVMLLFLMPDCKQESVKRCFDFLEKGLGNEAFKRLFKVFLTDNGSEFKDVDGLELSDDLTIRTSLYYCDPMASWQKAEIEKNHEYIRYVIPQNTSLNPYTEYDITLLMNHINSTKRESLNGLSPYDMISPDDKDMLRLMKLMKMEIIPADYVNLTASLLKIDNAET